MKSASASACSTSATTASGPISRSCCAPLAWCSRGPGPTDAGFVPGNECDTVLVCLTLHGPYGYAFESMPRRALLLYPAFFAPTLLYLKARWCWYVWIGPPRRHQRGPLLQSG